MTLYRALRPVLFTLDAERAHRCVFSAATLLGGVPGGLAGLAATSHYEHPVLAISAFGLRFSNPIGLAAGFDKDGELIAPLAALGFGFVELGTVTPRPQPGNPRPRLFRLARDGAVINRMGFNNAGASALASRLERLRERPVPLGVNLGKNKDTPLEKASEDYVAALAAVYTRADYLVINVSSPNTPGLRDLQRAKELGTILKAVITARDACASRTARRLPVLVKISPDLNPADLEDAAQAALEAGVDGVVATNTTLRREGFVTGPLTSASRVEAGGLSGRPLKSLALDTVRRLRSLVGPRVPIVGVGGISNGADAFEFVRAGATLVQLYTALVYEGPGLVRRIKRDLAHLLEREGFRTVADAIGSTAKGAA